MRPTTKPLIPSEPSRDQSEERMAHYGGADAPHQAMLALDAGRMGCWAWDITQGTVVGDPFVAKLLNLDYDSQPWQLDDVFASMHPDDLSMVQLAVDRALDGPDPYEIEFRDRITDPDTGEEGLRWLGARGKVTERDGDGAPLQMIGVNWDATPQKTHEQRLEMLAAEMDHRVKNAFAMMRALVNLGGRATDDKDTFVAELKGHIEAMANAHAISASRARETMIPNAAVPVDKLFQSALSPWTQNGVGLASAVSLTAEKLFAVDPHRVAPLSMLIHELVTNAAKHGALGDHDGTLQVSLSETTGGDLMVDWLEIRQIPQGDPHAATQQASGFGASLMSQCASILGATLTHDSTDTGLHLTIQMPLS